MPDIHRALKLAPGDKGRADWASEGAGVDLESDPGLKVRDDYVRSAVFDWLVEQVDLYGDVLPWSLLIGGVDVAGERVPLVSMQGIFKPRLLQYPLSIRTSPGGPYDDGLVEDDLLDYRYRGTDPSHRDNVGLRDCMIERRPLVYLHGVAKGRYLVQWPVFVVDDDQERRTFRIDLSGRLSGSLGGLADLVAEPERRYAIASVRQRLHQRAFRERVLAAYREQCAICRLRHRQLLDATHIIPDSEEGEPRVANGLALCKLHHAAFDAFFFGIRPDHRVVVRRSLLDEVDGPMLLHGLQGIHDTSIVAPRSPGLRPDPELLAQRFERFERAS